MDKFYLKNIALYEKLVDALDVTAPAAHFSRHGTAPGEGDAQEDFVAKLCNPDMIVSARIRPMLHNDLAERFPCAVYPRQQETGRSTIVDVHDLYNYPYGRPILKSTKHQVDKLYTADATTEDIFDDLVVDLVAFARFGGIGTLFAYGQTGSGKTHTISQLQKLAALCLINETLVDDQLELFITICDLAGNSAFDLLDSRSPVSVLQDSSGATQLAGAQEVQIYSEEDVLNLIAQATSYRQTASTSKNDTSSRSHSICRIRIKDTAKRSREPDGLLYLIDLAGSEAARDVASHGADRMRETKEINISLSVLKDCIRGKAEMEAARNRGRPKKKVHIPIRQSALTRVLKHVFDPDSGRESKTVVIACVNPSLADVASSNNTLRYAEMLRVAMPLPVARSRSEQVGVAEEEEAVEEELAF